MASADFEASEIAEAPLVDAVALPLFGLFTASSNSSNGFLTSVGDCGSASSTSRSSLSFSSKILASAILAGSPFSLVFPLFRFLAFLPFAPKQAPRSVREGKYV